MIKKRTTKSPAVVVSVDKLRVVVGGASSIYLDPTKSTGGLPPPPPPPTNG